MAKCWKCQKKGLFFKVNKDGLCAECEKLVAAEHAREEEQRRQEREAEERRRREERARLEAARAAEAEEQERRAREIREELARRETPEYIFAHAEARRFAAPPAVGCERVACHSCVQLKDVDRQLLLEVIKSGEYELRTGSDDGVGVVVYNGKKLGTLGDELTGRMVAQWADDRNPTYCEAIAFQEGAEAVGVAFYLGEKKARRMRNIAPEFDAIDKEKVAIGSVKALKAIRDYVVVDVETTGLSRTFDEIIEIAMLKVKDGEVADTYTTMVNPLRTIPANVTALTGISNADVKVAPTIDQVIDEVAAFLQGQIIMGHNVTFDLGFLCRALGSRMMSVRYVDTLEVSRKILTELPAHKLEMLMQHFGIAESQDHRALADVYATKQVFDACVACKEQQAKDTSAARKSSKKPAESDPSTVVLSVSVSYGQEEAVLHQSAPKINYHATFHHQENDTVSGLLREEHRLVEPPVNFVDEPITIEGMRFVITGDIGDATRDTITELVKEYGGRVTGALSGKTDYLAVGLLDAALLQNTESHKSTKIIQAEEMQAAGGKVKFIRLQSLFDTLMALEAGR